MPFGDAAPNWLWVSDAAAAVRLAVHFEGRTPTRVYNLRGDRRVIRDAPEIVRKLIPGAVITVEAGSADFAPRMDTTVVERELGWRPTTSLEEQLRLMLERAREEDGMSTTRSLGALTFRVVQSQLS